MGMELRLQWLLAPSEATGAASRQWAHKASLEVRVQCLAARNQAFCL